MKNPGNQTQQAQLPENPAELLKGSWKTFLVIGVLFVAFTNFNFIIDLMINIMIFIYGLVGRNFGLALILFTVLIRVLTWPLNAQQMKGQQAMQELQNDKEWIAVQKKYAKDKEKLAQEQFRIQRERGVNVFGSCLPMLIQFPILFALIPAINYAIGSGPLSILNLSRRLYDFQNAAELVPLNSKFLWMDMGLPERTEIFGFAIPVLALIVALTTYLQSKLTMPPSANPNDQSAQTAKIMSIQMPIMLFLFSVNYASGLSIYFIASNLLGIIQYAATGRVNWRNLLPGGDKNPPAKK
ncbi:MAG: YidC/Oxa1 family membrane protein insertase [Anaerolineales bacterium]|nr:MAG: YidC/Oxa1 family membrane protein insertase [Chloroflexota bacterium]MCE7859187.1 membrane protein insertase YidC [Chloroflexi bacterium CFX2]MCK6581821.1 YidC/Oxa1 family membrane protein insertase [Anaerolineales bacterium]